MSIFFRIKRSLYLQLLLILIVLAFVPLISMSYIGYKKFSDITFRTVAESNNKSLQQVEKYLDAMLSNSEEIMIRLSVNPEIQRMLAEVPLNEWEAYKDSLLYGEQIGLLKIGNPEIDRVTVFNSKGQRLDGIDRYKETMRLPHESYEEIQNMLADSTDVVMVGPVKTAKRGYLMSLGKKVLDINNGKPIGIIVVDIKLEFVKSELKTVNLFQQGKVVLTDNRGVILYHPYYPTDAILTERWVTLFHERSFYLGNDTNNTQNLFIQREMASTRWMLYGIVPYKLISNEIVSIQSKVLMYCLLMLLAISLITVFLRNLIVKPLQKLQRLMRAVESGNFNIQANSSRNDEIGQLERSFNIMIGKIKELIERVYVVKLSESRAQLLQKEAELEALQARITPHFLNNTLHSISWFAEKKGVREIPLIIDALSSMLRYSLDNSTKLVRLEDEFNYLNRYAEIIDFRYGGKIDFIYSVPEALSQVVIPRLTLQPIIENAVKYAFDDSEKRNRIIVNLYKQSADTVIIEIVDNGRGIEPQLLFEINGGLKIPAKGSLEFDGSDPSEHHQGMGLINVNHRLKLCFGDSYGLSLESTPGRGTAVILRIPIGLI